MGEANVLSPGATKAGLLDAATDAGWSWRGACRELELGEVRAYRRLERRGGRQWPTAAPAAVPCTGCSTTR
ncbi:MAG: hypothetical protein ACR2G7_09455 [Acidimicrobiales bacterium]